MSGGIYYLQNFIGRQWPLADPFVTLMSQFVQMILKDSFACFQLEGLRVQNFGSRHRWLPCSLWHPRRKSLRTWLLGWRKSCRRSSSRYARLAGSRCQADGNDSRLHHLDLGKLSASGGGLTGGCCLADGQDSRFHDMGTTSLCGDRVWLLYFDLWRRWHFLPSQRRSTPLVELAMPNAFFSITCAWPGMSTLTVTSRKLLTNLF